MRHTSILFALAVGALGGCRATPEAIAPLRHVGAGVPSDLPVLGGDDFAIIRLVING